MRTVAAGCLHLSQTRASDGFQGLVIGDTEVVVFGFRKPQEPHSSRGLAECDPALADYPIRQFDSPFLQTSDFTIEAFDELTSTKPPLPSSKPLLTAPAASVGTASAGRQLSHRKHTP